MDRGLYLFDQGVRTEHRPAHRAQSEFDFMNRSAWPAYVNIREALERWFEDYPAVAQGDLRARFRRSDHNHQAALFELFLHQLLLRLGLPPEVHPTPGSGKGRPDFAVTGVNGSRCYVEASVVNKLRWDSENPLENEILDAIDAVAEDQPTRIGVAVSARGRLYRSHRRSSIQREVRDWLDRIDPLSLSPTHFDQNPHLRVRRDDWVAELTAFGPLPRPSKRLIQGGPTKAGFQDEGALLSDSLTRKARRYGALDHPLVLAVNTGNVFTDGWEEQEALMGDRDGLWRSGSAGRRQPVHGVLLFRGLVPSNMHAVVAHLYVNPHTQAGLPEELRGLTSVQLRDGKWQFERGNSCGELLELPGHWPGEVTSSRWRFAEP